MAKSSASYSPPAKHLGPARPELSPYSEKEVANALEPVLIRLYSYGGDTEIAILYLMNHFKI